MFGELSCDLEQSLQQNKTAAQVPRDVLHPQEQSAPTDTPGVWRTIAINLQQTLPCPRLGAGAAYYRRKPLVYNFCVYDFHQKEGTMFVWDEVTGRRG